LSLVPLAVGAQVVIVRQLPSTGENKVQAQWGAAVPTADLLADVEHGRLVALTLADDDRSVERHAVHEDVATRTGLEGSSG
jgi:hypothetical protein